jgi:ribonuclease HI
VISVYSDGSSTGRANRPGGYGWVIVKDQEVLLWGYGGSPRTTNNVMELEGAIQGLRALMKMGAGDVVELVSDSQYTLGLATGKYSPSSNVDQAIQLRELFKSTGARGRWVRGHNGDNFNEYCDQLAKQGKKENS